MQSLTAFLQRLAAALTPIAEQLGGPGLTLIAFCDSSFLSLPEVCDGLILFLTIKNPSEWLYYAAMTTLGSVAGCFALYALARKGGHAFLRRRFRDQHIENGLAMFRRFGLLAIVVPALMPPPMPFKLFVLVAGIADVTPSTFIIAVLLGRGLRFAAVGWLAYIYGAQAGEFIRDNLPVISLWVAGVAVALGVATVFWRRRRAA